MKTTTAIQMIYEHLTNQEESFALVMTNISYIFSIVKKPITESTNCGLARFVRLSRPRK